MKRKIVPKVKKKYKKKKKIHINLNTAQGKRFIK